MIEHFGKYPKPAMWNWKQRLRFFGLLCFARMLLRRIIKGHWSIYIDRIGTSLSELTTEFEMTGSPYAPLTSGRLKKLIATINGSAATALFNAGYIKVSCTSFGGVEAFVPFSGPGIKTAPAFGGSHAIVEVDVDLAVKTGVNIRAHVKHETADTPITFEAQLFGVFQG